ncbi:TonB-dependent receptor plug domain-containing protein [Stenotrophomonas maltophilia]|uniref:TonB-dependent receptor plug domain-containing protein n=1 Tax=Stenotrophomonas maltophilia TaxID=40324 RepID=UPI003F871A43
MPQHLRSTPLFLALTTALLASTAPVFAHEPPAAHEGHGDEAVELDAVTVQPTRSGRRVSDEPIRVDVVSQEEIEEKQLMSPGNVSMLVAETAGVRVQNTSPGMGGSNIRIQGLRGRYTQLLADGLPLYGGQSSSIGLLQIPPTDLGSVEIIKGSASALYGPAALGGVVNLISRRPRDTREAEVLLNATSRGGQDLTGYVAGPLGGHWGLSMVGGYHRQDRQDLDGDGWADMPGYERMTLRPRAFWESEDGARALLTAGATRENRQGGTLPGRVVADGQPFTLTQHTERYDAGAVVELPMRESDRLQLRASAMTTRHRHRYGASPENDTHQTGFAELSYGSGFGNTNWLAGVAAQQDRFRSRQFQSFDYRYTVPAVFVQAEQTLLDDLILSGSARWDEHSAYGNHLSPRLSLLFRPRDWTVRASLGKGFHAPTPFVEEIEAAGLSRLEPLQGLRAETATTGAIDVGYAQGAWEANLSLFASNIDHAVRLVDSTTMPGERVQLVNVQGMTRTRGSELLLRYRWQDVTVTGSYVYTDAREPGVEGVGRRTVALTPRHTAGLVAMWEQHGRGRVGLEAYYTGIQALDDNPWRQRSRPYVELGALGEIVLGKVSLFLNLENLLNVRQSGYNPMLRPRRADDGQWTVDAWAPLEGFVVNGGMRVKF